MKAHCWGRERERKKDNFLVLLLNKSVSIATSHWREGESGGAPESGGKDGVRELPWQRKKKTTKNNFKRKKKLERQRGGQVERNQTERGAALQKPGNYFILSKVTQFFFFYFLKRGF